MALTKVKSEQLDAAQTSITSVGTLTGLNLSGGLTGTTAVFTTADNLSQVTLVSTDDDASFGPRLDLWRNSASPNVGDEIGRVRFLGEDAGGTQRSYAFIDGLIISPTVGAESGKLVLETKVAGTSRERITINASETIFNNQSQDLDFRVESDNLTNALFVRGSDGNVGIGTSSPAAELHVNAASENVNLRLTRDTNYGVQISGTDAATSPVLRLATINNGTLTERLRMNESELSPTTNQGMGLGTAGNRWNKLHVKTSATEQFYILGESTTADSSFMMSYFNTALSGSDSLTADRANYGIYSALNSSATGGDTSNEHRLYGIRSLVKATGDSDLIYGGYFTGEAEHSSGTVSLLYGSFNQATADPNSGGTISGTYGTFNQASINGSAGSVVTSAYGSYNKVITSASDEVAHSSLTGCYAEIETDASGTGRTSTTGYLFRGLYDDDSSAEHKFTNFYGLHLGGSNLATRVDGTGNVAGVYLDMPGVDQGFWNSEDQSNYFRGSLGIGSGARQVGDTAGAELHLVEPDGGELVLARYDTVIGTNNSLGKILFGGTEDYGTTVNFSASIQAFAQSAHSTTDADGYLSFYTAPQSSTTLEEQLRIDRAGTIKVIRGNIEMPTDQGISFANADASAQTVSPSSSVLDDYEEGQYVPTITVQSGSATMNTSNDALMYTKIGRQVTVNGRIRFSTTSASGYMRISLPFVNVTNISGHQGDYAYFSLAGYNVNTDAGIYGVFGEASPGNNYITLLQKYDNAAWSYWDASNFSSGDYLYVSGTYFTNS